MATSANPAPGAVAAEQSVGGDPFTTTPANGDSRSHRYSAFDSQLLSSYSTNSPSQAKRALEAHLAETERRLQDASKLGETLVDQRRELTARLKDVERHKDENEIGPELRQKLADLEREYNEVGKDAARAFIPKSRISSNTSVGSTDSPSVLSSDGRYSPSKLNVPTSRKQRNQPSNRVHDIEFATEISTSLLSQVRQLQAALAEKDESHKYLASEKSKLELDAEGFEQRLRAMDESEQRYKDENWNLETQLQDLYAASRESAEKEQRMTTAINAARNEKSAVQRELDELKLSHGKLTEDHVEAQKQHDLEISGLRRDANLSEHERGSLQKKIEELTSQNQELAKAVSYRFRMADSDINKDTASESEDLGKDQTSPEHSPPPSPSKMTPRHGGLESETLKSSLHHAQRMIQNLKGNIHREKTEKMELKRMLQDARDELEQRRGDGMGSNAGKRRKGNTQQEFKKPARPDRLGGAREPTSEIVDDDDWEEQDDEGTPIRAGTMRRIGSNQATALAAMAGETGADTTDAFETANEHEGTATETEAFQTGAESLAGDSSEELTETEETQAAPGVTPSSLISERSATRLSFQSTASTSGDEGDPYDLSTPSQPPRYRFKLSRGGYRKSTSGSRQASTRDSPASVISNQSQTGAGQSLAAELEDLDNSDLASAADGTPSKSSIFSANQSILSREASPEMQYKASPLAGSLDTIAPKPTMVDSGVMTEPWEPEQRTEYVPIVAGATAVGGAGYILAKHLEQANGEEEHLSDPAIADASINKSPESVAAVQADPVHVKQRDATPSTISTTMTQETEPTTPATPSTPERPTTSHKVGDSLPQVIPETPEALPPLPNYVTTSTSPRNEEVTPPAPLTFSTIEAQGYEPIDIPQPRIPSRSPNRVATVASPLEKAQENNDTLKPHSGLLGSMMGWTGRKSAAKSEDVDDEDREPSLQVERGPSPNEPRLAFAERENKSRAPMKELSNNAINGSRDAPQDGFQLIRPLRLKQTDEATQTMVSSEDMDALMRAKAKKSLNFSDVPSSPSKSLASGRGSPKRLSEPLPEKMALRPGSSGSTRKTGLEQPPLPADHKEIIAAASQKGPAGTMGPPNIPASAYRSNSQLRPRTPTGAATAGPFGSRSGTTPRPRINTGRNEAPSPITRRSSVSSFASELDERFNIGRNGILPEGLPPQTDPRMIQAITQTMIGEFLWKYTRKAGRGDMSENRHQRYFWVHPYTRTLYWSEQDPGTAGRAQQKAKSVAIESVHVVTDDNPMPPGLHRKSIVIVTPGRSIKFTAPTSQRHETWFNALSYLLLRTGSERHHRSTNSTNGSEAGNDSDINDTDVAEFNPGSSSQHRSSSRLTRGSRISLASFASRTPSVSTAQRNASPVRPSRDTPTLAQRQSAAAARAAAVSSGSAPEPSPTRTALPTQQRRAVSQTQTQTQGGSVSGRLSSLSGMVRGSFSSRRSQRGVSYAESESGSGVYEGGAGENGHGSVQDSAEDLRRVIQRQEREADRLENVRACCDGKHDVGVLTRDGKRNASVSSRNSHRHSTTRSLSRMSKQTEGE
ncbi:MAG: hypothetical protein Q9165_000479 [Trypethelium subeluteriae]